LTTWSLEHMYCYGVGEWLECLIDCALDFKYSGP
jgi:hypothetical protein